MEAPVRKAVAYTADDFQRTAKWFYETLVPAMAGTGVLSVQDVEAISHNFVDDSTDELVQEIFSRLPDNPKGRAAALFITANYKLLAFEAMACNHEVGCDEWPTRDEDFLDLEATVSHLAGYMHALIALEGENYDRTSQATAAKIESSERKKRRVEEEAEKYRGKMTRERAAILVADSVGITPGYARRLLSELFPGDAW